MCYGALDPWRGWRFSVFGIMYESHLFCLRYRRGCMLSAPYGVHAHCWKVLMFSQLDDFGGDYKD